MTAWDDLPAAARNSGTLDQLRPLLEATQFQDRGIRSDSDGDWHVYEANVQAPQALAWDPSGGFRSGTSSSSSLFEMPNPQVTIEAGLHQTGGSNDGGWRLIVSTPIVLFRPGGLTGAEMDGRGFLRPNGQQVKFTLPGVRLQTKQLAGGSLDWKVLSLSTAAGGTPPTEIYEFIRMDPGYALVGPGTSFGFAFRTAVLDLSGDAGPGVPPGARAMPADWQGLWLPDVRVFVAVDGLDGLALNGGARNLWIGWGEHAGITGVFELEAVNRAAMPAVFVSFRTTDGRWIPDPGSAVAELPAESTIFVDARGGKPPLTSSITFGGQTAPGDRFDVRLTDNAQTTITVTVTDGDGATTNRQVALRRDPAAAGVGGGGVSDVSAVRVTPKDPNSQHRIVIVSETATHATVALQPRQPADWVWPNNGVATNTETATVPVGTNVDVEVTATVTTPAEQTIDAFFPFDKPVEMPNSSLKSWALANARCLPAPDRKSSSQGATVRSTLDERLASIPDTVKFNVTGWASYEGKDDQKHVDRNQGLSDRRRDALCAVLIDANRAPSTVIKKTCTGHTDAQNKVDIDGHGEQEQDSERWWRARAVTEGATARVNVTATLRRPAARKPGDTDAAPPPSTRPPCFRRLGARVELLRSTFIRFEVFGEFDIETAAEQSLARRAEPRLRNRTNPMDGVCAFAVRLRIATDRNSWEVAGEFRAAEGDLDGLAELKRETVAPRALNVLGAAAVTAPLGAAAADLSPAAGTLVSLGAVALGAADVIETRKLVLRGAELVVSDGVIAPDGDLTANENGTVVSVLFDVETVFTADLRFISVDDNHPITVRYKAVGVRTAWDTGTGNEFLPIPIFDPARGYTLDIPAASLKAKPPFDELLRVLGVRVSRDNPAYLEVEVGVGFDVGVVTFDSIRVRAKLDSPPSVTLTKLAATVDIPGALRGTGSLELTDGGFAGAFDLTIVPLNIRAAATLAFQQGPDGTVGILIGAEVEFPAPIPIANSGLGIYGFLGGFGTNFGRKQPQPAIDWFERQLAGAGVMDPAGWEFKPGNFAIAAGILLGTADGGFVAHLKGIVLIEVPGPRLVLAMKADILKVPPELNNASQKATFLAVLEIDFGQGTISLGVVAGYTVDKLLEVRVPADAFFTMRQPANWEVNLGQYDETKRVTVKVLNVLSGDGYLMVHGNGLTIPGLPPVATGMGVGVGFHVTAVLMGSKSIGLYFQASAGFDAIVGLDPLFLAGKITARGELRLWIVSVSARASLEVVAGQPDPNSSNTITKITGEVCGKVEFVFFDIEGCVRLSIGPEVTITPTPPDLIAGVVLLSRSPALVEGSGVERPVDAKLADAAEVGSGDPTPKVPLDAIPVVVFNTAPIAGGATVLGGQAQTNSGVTANPWVRVGERWWAFKLTEVKLNGQLLPPGGKTPHRWWPASQGDTSAGTALALLNWTPIPFPRAVPFGDTMTSIVTTRWGTVCTPVAPAAPALWTFDTKPLGPSTIGWRLTGVPWPDLPGTKRVSRYPADAHVSEPWRCGDPTVDIVHGTGPAIIVGDSVRCPAKVRRAVLDDNPAKSPFGEDPGVGFSNRATSAATDAFDEIAVVLANGGSMSDVAALRRNAAWDPASAVDERGCEGRILRSPLNDSREPAPFGTDDDRQFVGDGWGAAGHKPDELIDAVRISFDGGVRDLAMLLLVPAEVFNDRLAVRFEDADGSVIDGRALDGTDLTGSQNPIPAEWNKPDGPWADPVQRAGQVASVIANSSDWPKQYALVHDRLGGIVFTSVVIGWLPDMFEHDRQRPPEFHVVALTGYSGVDILREDFEQQSSSGDKGDLNDAVNGDPDDHALLDPGEHYQLDISYQYAEKESDGPPGQPPADADWINADTVSYRFDPDPTAPRDLRPWVLATTPSMGEVGVFHGLPLQIVYENQKVAELFDAYGKELRVVVRAASGKHPVLPNANGDDFSLTVPLAIESLNPIAQVAVGRSAVHTPFEKAVHELLADASYDTTCIPSNNVRVRHAVQTIQVELEPLTDYLIDIHAVTKGLTVQPGNLVHRVGFTTSTFEDAAAMAATLQGAAWQPRLVATPDALTDAVSLPDRPAGDQLDRAFQLAGLGVPLPPTLPLVQVLWSPDQTPQPVAVVIESSEPLWRTRLTPTEISADADAPDPNATWWEARPREWLSLEQGTGGGGDLPAAAVTRIVRGPGGTRAVVLLGAGARGGVLSLDLVQQADPLTEAGAAPTRIPAVAVPLLAAPWEVPD